MSTTITSGSADEFEPEPDRAEAGSIPDEHDSSTSKNKPRPALGATPLVSLGIAVAVSALLQSPDVRKTVRSVLQDPELHKVCREAGDMVCREAVAAWRRHGGMDVFAKTFLR